jgi:Insertion element 4 transposase N-terminal/Transposase DDE domain
MNVLSKDADVVVRWSDAERARALKRIVSKKAIENALRRSGHPDAPCARLPRWFVVWFVIALGLFFPDSYRQVFRWLMRFRKKFTPGRSTLCEARKSVGPAPLRLLADEVIQLAGRPETPHAFYKGLRLMAMDSFVVDVFDSPQNVRAFGKPKGGRSEGAFPQARVLSLCEVGTHVLWKSLIKPQNRGEVPMARYLLRFLQENMLLLWDRNFPCYDLVQRVQQQGAHVLARLKDINVFQPIRRLPDRSFVAKLYPSSYHRQKDRDGILVRVLEYTFYDPGRPGSGQKHRLITTLLSAREHPAKRLIELYHERWEEELAFDELKTHQRERPVLRSQTPRCVVQEIYGLLLGHYVIRKLMCEAADQGDVAPRQLSFVNTLKILRCRLPEAPRSPKDLANWFQNLLEEILEEQLEPRRNRVNPRVTKRKMSKWAKKREKHLDLPQPTKSFRRSIAMLD